jgi:hypothetical protein
MSFECRERSMKFIHSVRVKPELIEGGPDKMTLSRSHTHLRACVTSFRLSRCGL